MGKEEDKIRKCNENWLKRDPQWRAKLAAKNRKNMIFGNFKFLFSLNDKGSEYEATDNKHSSDRSTKRTTCAGEAEDNP